MTPQEAREVLGDVRAYLASRASLENETLAGHTFTDICNAIKALEQPSVTDFADKCKECGKILNDKLQTRWIPVSEGLPEAGQRVLVTDKFEAVTTALYFGKSPFWREMVVAWMPLPQAYKESEDNVCKDCYYNDGDVHAECVVCDKAESGDEE